MLNEDFFFFFLRFQLMDLKKRGGYFLIFVCLKMILFRLMMMTLRPNVYANPTKPNKVVSHGRVFLLEIIKKAKGPIKFYFHGLTKEGNFFPSSFFLWKSADFRSAQNYASSRGKKSLAFAQLPFKYISTTKGVSFSFWGSLVYARKECQRGGNGLKMCVFTSSSAHCNRQ